MRGIDINGKFLGAPLNGVHRTAAEFSEQLLTKAPSAAHARIVAPRPFTPSAEFAHVVPQRTPGALGAGQAWEMLTLPWISRGRLLVNFCNLAPLLHPNSVVMIHDAQTFLFPEDYTGRQAKAYRRMLPWIGRRARRILTVSAFARKSLIDCGIAQEDKIDVVHNGTDHLLRHAEDPSILERFSLKPGKYVLALGSSKGYKNLRTVFAALGEPLPGAQPLVVAGGPAEQAYLSKGWKPPTDTIFTGFVSDAQLRALYGGAGAFLFPSLTEGFGLPPVEAMHASTPVIAAAAGAMPEVCADGALLVPPNDPSAWRDAITAVLDTPDLASDLVQRGHQRAGQLTWNAAGDRLWQVIAPLL